ncbi:hypothetical protein GALMADRAFT_34426, partial [Galerina marginata CBS 339.88]
QINVISLPDRTSRRFDMEKLRLALGLEWNYIEALPAHDSLVGGIIDWVNAKFAWPHNIDELAMSSQDLDLWSSDIPGTPARISSPPPYRPITCATKNSDVANFSSSLPEYLVLTPARIACWHSHLSIIHRLANELTTGDTGVAFILEDDVDMEIDIAHQLRGLWPLLPELWDIVFLGHCWSDEHRGRLLSPGLSKSLIDDTSFQLYESTSPKCTHAYALSRIGARRLLLHLRYSPFAYSRAIDQAFSWLVESGRLKSFSVVPSLAVQRKIADSDVMVGKGAGSKWIDTLTKGVFS